MNLVFTLNFLLVLTSTIFHVVTPTNNGKLSKDSSMLSKSINLYSVDESGDPITDDDRLSIYSKPSKPCFFFCKFFFYKIFSSVHSYLN